MNFSKEPSGPEPIRGRITYLFDWAFWFGVGLIGIALLAPLIQALIWLRTGEWMSLPISWLADTLGYDPRPTDWKGFNTAVSWLADQHISLLFIGVATLALVFSSEEAKKH